MNNAQLGNYNHNRTHLRQKQHETSKLNDNPTLSDQQRQEERRGEELRRQIRLREKEIEEISRNKERLLDKIQNTLSVKPPHTHSTSLSPSRHHHHNRSSQSPVRSVHTFGNQSLLDLHKKESMKLLHQRTFTAGDTQLKEAVAQAMVQQHTPAQQDYIEKLIHDTNQLQTRLQVVSADLQKVQKDKSAYLTRLNDVAQDVSDYQEMLADGGQKSDLQRHTETLEFRDHNKRLQYKLQEIEHTRNGVLHELNIIQQEKDRRLASHEDLQADLTQKMLVHTELGQNLVHFKAVIQQNIGQISVLEQAIQDDSHRSHEIGMVLDRFRDEVNHYQLQYQHLQAKFDHDSMVLSQDRQHFEMHNRRHIQLMSVKQLEQLLNQAVKNQRQAVLNEFFQYCKFDSNCHRTLKTLAQILYNLGVRHKERGFLQWHQRAFKPVRAREINEELAVNYHNLKLKHLGWQLWIQAYMKRYNEHCGQEYSVGQMWKLKKLELQKEKLRVVKIWRDTSVQFTKRGQRIKYLYQRQRDRLVAQALQKWRFINKECDFQVRQYIVQQRFCIRQMKLIAFHNLKSRIKDKKAMRLLRLSHLLKGWQDSQAYNKYMKNSDALLNQLNDAVQTLLKQSIFDTLKQSKEQDKHDLVSRELNERILPLIEQLNTDLEETATVALRRFKLRRLQALQSQIQKRLSSYFHHWLSYHQYATDHTKIELKQIIVRRYFNQIRRAFNFWQTGEAHIKQFNQTEKNKQLGEDGRKIQQTKFEASQQIQKEEERQQMWVRIGLQSCIKIFHRRSEKRAMQNWLHTVKSLKALEQASGVILEHLRRKMCKNGFKLLCEANAYRITLQRLDRRCLYFQQTKILQKKRYFFNSLLKFKCRFVKAKEGFALLLQKQDIWIQRNHFFKWQEQGNNKAIQHALQAQNNNSKKFDLINVSLGESVQKMSEHQTRLQEERKRLLKQGRKVLSNAFARSYYSMIQRGFKKWKDVMDSQRHREHYVKERILHFQQGRFYITKAAFQAFVQNQRKKEIIAQTELNQKLEKDAWRVIENQRAEQLRIVGPESHLRQPQQISRLFIAEQSDQPDKEEDEISDVASDNHDQDNYDSERIEIINQQPKVQYQGAEDHQRNLIHQVLPVVNEDKPKPTLRQQISRERADLQLVASKLSQLTQNNMRKCRHTNFHSKLRFMFQQWAKFAKNQKRFVMQFTRIVTKSVWQDAFNQISRFAHYQHTKEMQQRALIGMVKMRTRNYQRRAIDEWRDHLYTLALLATETAFKTQCKEIALHKKYKQKVKEYQSALRVRLLKQLILKNHLKAWRNVHKFYRAMGVATHHLSQSGYEVHRAVLKWRQRAQLTSEIRKKLKRFKLRLSYINKKMIFRLLKGHFTRNKNFYLKLAQMAFKYDQYQQQRSVQVQKFFVWSRKARDIQMKRIASLDLASTLHQLYKRKMCGYNAAVKRSNFEFKMRKLKLRAVFGCRRAIYLRSIFFNWKNKVNQIAVANEIENEGPIEVEVSQARQHCRAIHDFLGSQAYSKLEIDKIALHCDKHQKYLVAKSVARLQHKAKGEELKPIAFDRWRMWLNMRRLAKYLLRNVENKLHPVKADLSIAFNRWKMDKKHLLVGKDRGELAAVSEKNQRLLTNLKNLQDQAQLYMNQLLHTRDELVDNLMGSQRLAIALGRDNLERSTRQAVGNLSDQAYFSKKGDLQEILRSRLDQIQHLKQRMIDLEDENLATARENEELRQFSLDGYAIAKNVKLLTKERQKLSVDLSDKTNTLQHLLDENDNLNSKLNEVLHYHASLMHQQQQLLASGGRY